MLRRELSFMFSSISGKKVSLPKLTPFLILKTCIQAVSDIIKTEIISTSPLSPLIELCSQVCLSDSI